MKAKNECLQNCLHLLSAEKNELIKCDILHAHRYYPEKQPKFRSRRGNRMRHIRIPKRDASVSALPPAGE